ncbi:hypothetical protein [Sanguibacter sp. Leaf3]|uniref:hypothetical protein n=1 Tax=Sanguibacter sp. Leaf3 TaxID=1736209 RepID=UPI000ABDB192|nr:hypothetical protein [Sanguibacter sp. Leaf3]
MTTSLTTFTQSTRAVGAPGGRGEMTSSLSTSGVEFTERALTWTDVAPAGIADRASGRAIGSEAVVQVRGAHRTATGFEQRRIGYRAMERGVTLIRATRPLVQTETGAMKPTGPWTARFETHTVDEESIPLRRTGVVGPGALRQPSAPTSTAGAGVHREAESALEAEAFLPSSVQATLAAAVPSPTTHVGNFLLWSKPSGDTQEVNVLRMDGRTAVVVRATRPHRPDAAWEVTQTTYDLKFPTDQKTIERRRP